MTPNWIIIGAPKAGTSSLFQWLADHPQVGQLRGRGLMVAAEVNADAPDVAKRALMEQKLILNATGATTLRFLPPLIVSDDEIDEAVARLRPLLG